MTALWDAADLLAATGGRLRTPFAANGVSIDSRTIAPGALFVALATESGDGHDYVADALARGAAGAMVHRLPPGVAENAPLLRVGDTLDGLRGLGAFGRARFGGRVVAVTGSVGKTTTKEMLRAILSAFGPTWAAEASHNNHWGVPLTLARLAPAQAFCVVEIGMNHAGEIAPLARLAHPHIAGITALAPAHIGNMGSLEAIAREKLSIADGLAENGTLVLPAEAALLRDMAASRAGVAIRLFGIGAQCSTRLLSSRSDATSNTVEAIVHGEKVSFVMNAPGEHMALDAMAALEVAASLGLDAAHAAAALSGFAPVGGRGARRIVHLPDGEAILLDESYNASSASVAAALRVLSHQHARRTVAVLGDMLELGAFAEAEHSGLARELRERVDVLYTCGPMMRLLHDAAPPAMRGAHAPDSATLAPIVASALRAGDAVLVKGSLGSRMKLVVQAIEARG